VFTSEAYRYGRLRIVCMKPSKILSPRARNEGFGHLQSVSPPNFCQGFLQGFYKQELSTLGPSGFLSILRFFKIRFNHREIRQLYEILSIFAYDRNHLNCLKSSRQVYGSHNFSTFQSVETFLTMPIYGIKSLCFGISYNQ